MINMHDTKNKYHLVETTSYYYDLTNTTNKDRIIKELKLVDTVSGLEVEIEQARNQIVKSNESIELIFGLVATTDDVEKTMLLKIKDEIKK